MTPRAYLMEHSKGTALILTENKQTFDTHFFFYAVADGKDFNGTPKAIFAFKTENDLLLAHRCEKNKDIACPTGDNRGIKINGLKFEFIGYKEIQNPNYELVKIKRLDSETPSIMYTGRRNLQLWLKEIGTSKEDGSIKERHIQFYP